MRIAVLDAPSRPSRWLGVRLQGNSAGTPHTYPPLDHSTDRTPPGRYGCDRLGGDEKATWSLPSHSRLGGDEAGAGSKGAAGAAASLDPHSRNPLPRAAITGRVPKPLEHDPPARMRTSALARVMVQVVSCSVSCLGSCGTGACGRSRGRCEADVEPRPSHKSVATLAGLDEIGVRE